MSKSILDNKYFNKLSVNKLIANKLLIKDSISALKTIIENNINRFGNLKIPFNNQILHLSKFTQGGELDIMTNFTINNEEFIALNNNNIYCKFNIISLQLINDNYKAIIKNNYDYVLYTTYTKENRSLYFNNIKLDKIKECAGFMIETKTVMVVNYNNNSYLVQLLSGHEYTDDTKEFVEYEIKFLYDLNNLDVNFDKPETFENKNYLASAVLSRSFYNCGGSDPPFIGQGRQNFPEGYTGWQL